MMFGAGRTIRHRVLLPLCGSRGMSSDGTGTVVPRKEVVDFVVRCMEAVGTKRPNALAIAEVLAEADYRGHYSHGLNRLEMYIHDLKMNICDANVQPSILKETAATAYVDGNNGLGPVVGNFCMDLAIKKAKEAGVGWVIAKGSNHYGIAGWYSIQAMQQGLIGMSMTNTSPLVAPTRAKKAALGTNPLTVAAPAKDGDSFLLDMATSAVAVGKIEMQKRKEEPIPKGWAIGPGGQMTTDPQTALMGALMPLGGAELHSGYKGYGLGLMVELFCGILAGGSYGPNVRKWMSTAEEANLGQCFVALNPECFAPGYHDRLQDLMNFIRKMEPTEPHKPVLIAGDPEKIRMKENDDRGGIQYHPNQMKACAKWAQDLKVSPPKTIA
ncbi:unnamed protein product [Darwinula stevensoni]|uniref:Malate dehydrogenase n=1 Tax=Darwinula stevensoni TaxID=69355 RepID=A0A7R9AAG1_9CRUS|nr:unnamed protein product [Darwinula stevensoni]CAG0898130.1 unnamed protein product [Darwinula stevensoni]